MAEINMRQIEVFLTAARHQNISKAAEELFISQPSLSKYISKMESEVGVPLFRRTNRGVVLTEQGEEFYARLDFEYNRFRVNVEEICRPPMEKDKSLRIGCINRQTPFNLIRDQIQGYSLRYPDVPVWLERFDPPSLRSKLLSEELDLIVTIENELKPEQEYEYLPLSPYPFFLLVPNAWAEEGLQALSGKTLMIESPAQRAHAEAVCREYGIVPGGVRYVSSYAMLTMHVIRKEGFSADGKIVDSPQELSYLPVKRAFCGTVVLAWRKGADSEVMRRFIDFVRPGDELSAEGFEITE